MDIMNELQLVPRPRPRTYEGGRGRGGEAGRCLNQSSSLGLGFSCGRVRVCCSCGRVGLEGAREEAGWPE